MNESNYERWMEMAIHEAAEAVLRGDQPYGAVLVSPENTMVARCGNSENTRNDPSAHAEMNAIRTFCSRHDWGTLSDLTLVASCAPCNMCAATAFQLGVTKIVFGTTSSETSQEAESRLKKLAEICSTSVTVVPGISETECSEQHSDIADLRTMDYRKSPTQIILSHVRLHDRSGIWDVQIENGRISDVVPNKGASNRNSGENTKTNKINCSGKVLMPSLVDPHIHLEKAFLEERRPSQSGTLTDAIRVTAELKADFTHEDMYQRGKRLLQRMEQSGVGHARAHVEIDPILELRALDVAEQLQSEFRGRVEVQIVIFPQEGIQQAVGTEGLMKAAARRNIIAIGGVPYNDINAKEHLRTVFNLATEFGLDIDLHVDFTDDPDRRDILTVIDFTREYGMHGKVNVGHLTSLSSIPSEEMIPISDAMAECGISVIALPATDLYLSGKEDKFAQRRGITPVRELLKHGVNVCCGSNNTRNAFTPFGNGDLLLTAFLLAVTAQFGTRNDQQTVLDLITQNAARAIGVNSSPIRKGRSADLVLLDVEDSASILSNIPARLLFMRNGCIIFDHR